MQYFPDILKIIDGGLHFKPQTVVNYARALQQRLEQDGEYDQAKLIQAKLDGAEQTLTAYGATTSVRLPTDDDSRSDLATVETLEAGNEHAILDEHIREDVERFLQYARNAEALEAAGVGISPRMLIYGPPGVGKTQLARHIGAELGLPVITARCDALISSYLGSTAKNIRKLFEHAANTPCLLFLDEFDALAKARDDAQELGELKRVVVGLLQNIDALPTATVLIAATNHEQLLDEAVWRRFAYRLRLDLPRPELREALLQAYLGRFSPREGLEHALHITHGFSGALLRESAEECIREAVLSNEPQVTQAALLRKLAQTAISHRRMTPSAEAVATFLLQGGVPQRTTAAASFLSMRKIQSLARSIKEQVIRTEETHGGTEPNRSSRTSSHRTRQQAGRRKQA